jgi:FKBP-type peptidyl-prolyl cis-trans isomerase 2
MPERPNYVPLVILVVIVVAAASAGSALLFLHNLPKGSAPPRVAVGDNVTVNYIGSFGSTPQAGRVFDTSIYSVATNNATYPKSLEYTPRASIANYTPLPFYVGGSVPSGGYSFGGLTFSTVITGFWQGVVGMAGNSTRILTIPPSAGYGPLNQSCLFTQPLSYTVPVNILVPSSEFSSLYPGVEPLAGVQFKDPVYGWNDTVLSANSTTVVVQNQPPAGFITHPNGWVVTVTNVSGSGSGAITLVNQLTVASTGLVLGHTTGSQTQCGQSQFIVSNVNVANGTYTENFNREVVGATLIFQVTVVDIWPPQ